jgi:hypothetical protein
MGEQQAMAAKTAQGKDNPEGKSDRKTLSKAPTLGVLSRAVYSKISEAYLKHQCAKFKDLDSQTQGEGDLGGSDQGAAGCRSSEHEQGGQGVQAAGVDTRGIHCVGPATLEGH